MPEPAPDELATIREMVLQKQTTARIWSRYQGLWQSMGYTSENDGRFLEYIENIVSSTDYTETTPRTPPVVYTPVAASGESFSQPVAVSYAGVFNSQSGYGSAALNNLIALLKTGMHAHTPDGAPPEIVEKYGHLLTARRMGCAVTVAHFIPTMGRLGDIICTTHELNAIPNEWIRAINRNYKVMWTSSEYSKKLFTDAGVTIPTTVVPYALDTKTFSPNRWPLNTKVKGEYRFLFVGQWMERKNVTGMLKAYLKAFGPDDAVNLILRSHSDCDNGSAVQLVTGAIKKLKTELGISRTPKITYLEAIDHKLMPNLYATADCLLFPVRCEGFGYPLIEAMATGKPVITSDWPAMNEIVTSECGYLVDTEQKLMKAEDMAWAPDAYKPNEGAFWGDPSEESLIEAMRKAFENPEEGFRKGLAGRRRFMEKYTHEIVGSMMKRSIEAML